MDYGFEGIRESVPAGPVPVSLTNEGSEEHQAVLVRLDDGVTPDQYLASAAEDPAAAYELLEGRGGPSPLAPGEVMRATSVLTPGTYPAICFIPSPSDGTPHADKGMVAAFQVTERDGARAARVRRDHRGERLQLRRAVGLHRAGHRLRGQPRGQAHELAVYRIEDGKTFADVEAFLATPPDAEHAGPPPMVAAGGVGDLVPGRQATVDLDLAAGDYAFVCFLPDVTAEGAPHFTRGMLQEVAVG